METVIHKELSYKVLGMAYTVHNILGPGLLEYAYKEAMCVELRLAVTPIEDKAMGRRGFFFHRVAVKGSFYKKHGTRKRIPKGGGGDSRMMKSSPATKRAWISPGSRIKA